jgi:hypothetical protein
MLDFALEGGFGEKLLGLYRKDTCGSLSSVVAFECGRMHECLGGEVAPRSNLRAHLAEIGPAITPYYRISSNRTALAQSQFLCALQDLTHNAAEMTTEMPPLLPRA